MLNSMRTGTLGGIVGMVHLATIKRCLVGLKCSLAGGEFTPPVYESVKEFLTAHHAEILNRAAGMVGDWAEHFFGRWSNPAPGTALWGAVENAVHLAGHELLVAKSVLRGVDPSLILVFGLYQRPWPVESVYFFSRPDETKLNMAMAFMNEERITLPPWISGSVRPRFWWGTHPTDEQAEARQRLAASILHGVMGQRLTPDHVSALAERLNCNEDKWAVSAGDLLTPVMEGVRVEAEDGDTKKS